MNYQSILYSVTNRVATITLNRPEAMNAINAALRQEIRAAIDAAAANEDVRAIVIAASGRGFSAGTDLLEVDGKHDTYGMLEREYKPLLNAVLQCPKPVIAAVSGACAGIGASLALACDLVVMGEGAFIYLAFANVGLIADGGLHWHLVRSIGSKRAFEVIAGAGRISASECLGLGLANKVVPDEQLRQECQQRGERLAQAAPLTLKFAKLALQQAARLDLSDTMHLEASLQAMCSRSEDAREGIQAFKEKRKPVFQGK